MKTKNELIVYTETLTLLIEARVGARRFGNLGAVVTTKEEDRQSVIKQLEGIQEVIETLIQTTE